MYNSNRFPQLDFLRSLAVFMVLWFHFSNGMVAQAGWAGVDLFFVLSGFLVSGLLFAEYKQHGDIAVKRFLVRRGWKIYPAFWTLILATILVEPEKARPLSLACELGFIQNYGPGLWMHTWSLAVEEHFYLAVAVILTFMARRGVNDPFRRLPAWGFAAALAALAMRGLTAAFLPDQYKMNTFGTHLRFDALVFGVILAYWYRHHYDRLRECLALWRAPILIMCVVTLAPTLVVPKTSLWFRTAGLTLADLGFTGILAALVTSDRAAAVLRGRHPLAWFSSLGAYSYSIYLWHTPTASWLVHPLIKAFFKSPSPAMVALACVAISVLTGIVMSKLVEAPCLRLRDRLVPRRARTVRPALEQAGGFESQKLAVRAI